MKFLGIEFNSKKSRPLPLGEACRSGTPEQAVSEYASKLNDYERRTCIMQAYLSFSEGRPENLQAIFAANTPTIGGMDRCGLGTTVVTRRDGDYLVMISGDETAENIHKMLEKAEPDLRARIIEDALSYVSKHTYDGAAMAGKLLALGADRKKLFQDGYAQAISLVAPDMTAQELFSELSCLSSGKRQQALDDALEGAAGRSYSWLAGEQKLEYMRTLIQLGANVNADKGAALRAAAEAKDSVVMNFLLERGADADIAYAEENRRHQNHRMPEQYSSNFVLPYEDVHQAAMGAIKKAKAAFAKQPKP